LDAQMQFSKIAYFQLSLKHRKLKEYSAFMDARNSLDDDIECNFNFKHYFL
jgi:hypothetical protein